MFQATYLWLGTFALLASVGAMRQSLDWLTRTLAAAFATVAWSVWAVSSFAVSVPEASATEAYASLAALGAVAALLMLLVTVRYAFGGIREDSTSGFSEVS